MQSVITNSLKLKAEAYQYQVARFGNYRPQKPLNKAIGRSTSAVNRRNCSPASTHAAP